MRTTVQEERQERSLKGVERHKENLSIRRSTDDNGMRRTTKAKEQKGDEKEEQKERGEGR